MASEDSRAELRLLKDFESSIETGFQLATFQGPLCAEPIVGMAWTVESIEHHRGDGDDEAGKSHAYRLMGRIMRTDDQAEAARLPWWAL